MMSMVVMNARQCCTRGSSGSSSSRHGHAHDMQLGKRVSLFIPTTGGMKYSTVGHYYSNRMAEYTTDEGGAWWSAATTTTTRGRVGRGRRMMVCSAAQQSKKKKGAARDSGGFGGFGTAKQGSTPKTTCPCGSRKLYGDCCGKYHTKKALPKTAEELMRSRYAAYAKGLVEYIVDTTHPDNPLAQKDGGVSLRKDVIATCKKISWDKLVVLETENVSENEAYVTFQTYFKVKGQQGQRSQGFHTQSFVEKSRFLKSSDGVWLYENGEQDWEGNQWV